MGKLAGLRATLRMYEDGEDMIGGPLRVWGLGFRVKGFNRGHLETISRVGSSTISNKFFIWSFAFLV